MPFGSEGAADQIGIALSGGGFRATLFHVGSLRRLVELGILTRAGRISSISGGSINAGRLAQVWDEFAADPTVANYEKLIGQPLRAFCRRNIDARAAIEGLLSPWTSAGAEVEQEYAKHVVDKRLDQLPDSPVFVINATNLQTGRSFRFTKKYMGDYRIGLVDNPTLPIARAVAASSAFPPILSPVVIKNPGAFRAVPGADLAGNAAYTGKLFLTDGGVYDNLGLETVWNRCSTVLVSDAGAPFAVTDTVKTDLVQQTMRALDVATDQSRALRKRALIDDFKRGERAGTYWGIDTNIADYDLPDPLPCKEARVRARRDPDPTQRLQRPGAGRADQLGLCADRRRHPQAYPAAPARRRAGAAMARAGLAAGPVAPRPSPVLYGRGRGPRSGRVRVCSNESVRPSPPTASRRAPPLP